MSREYKLYEIRSTKRPAKNELLSTTVAISGADGKPYYCYINFSDKLVERVGKVLPAGLTKERTGFLVVSIRKDPLVLVDACYAFENKPYRLWSQDSLPNWLKFYPARKG